MSGRVLGATIVIVTLLFGAAVYWVQEYAYYERLPADTPITLVNRATGEPERIEVTDFQGIDAASSPLRFRACFRPLMSEVTLSETYEPYPNPTPLTGPRWFTCYNAVEIGEALERGEAMAFLSVREIHDGVDRVVAVFPDGRAYAWHQLNEKYQE